MKKILMIAPSSYPVFGAEAIVNIKLLKALTNSHDFEIDLISKKSKWSDYPTNTLEDLGVRVNSLYVEEVDNNLSLKTIWLHLKSLVIFGSVFKGSHWAVKVLPKIKELVRKNDYDYVLTKNAPSLLLGYYLRQKYGLKWAATWNDPYPIVKYPIPYGKGCYARLNSLDKLQLRIMRQADVHIFPNNRLRKYMLTYLNVPYEKTIIIPHVVNNQSSCRNRGPKNTSKLRLIHSGNILSPRNPQNLIKAINRLQACVANKLNIIILGVNNPKDFSDANQKEAVFKFLPPVTYCDSIRALNQYDVAIILEAPCEEGIFLPTKVSDFMQNNIPIWAISPLTGILNDLYKNGNIPYFSNIEDVESIEKTLMTIYNDYRSGNIRNNIIPIDYMEESIIKQYKAL